MLVYINDMVINSYTTKTNTYVSVRELMNCGFKVEIENDKFNLLTTGVTPPSSAPIDGYPETYEVYHTDGRDISIYPVYNSPYKLKINGIDSECVYVHSVPTFNTPCVSVDVLAHSDGITSKTVSPAVIKLYTKQ